MVSQSTNQSSTPASCRKWNPAAGSEPLQEDTHEQAADGCELSVCNVLNIHWHDFSFQLPCAPLKRTWRSVYVTGSDSFCHLCPPLTLYFGFSSLWMNTQMLPLTHVCFFRKRLSASSTGHSSNGVITLFVLFPGNTAAWVWMCIYILLLNLAQRQIDFRHWPTLTDLSGVWTGAIWNWHLTAWFSEWWVMTCANREVRNGKTGWIISVESSVCLYLQIYLSIYRQMMCDITTAHLLIIWRHMWGRHCWILLASPDDCLCCRVSQKTLWMSCWAGTVMTRWSCEILTTWRSERRRSTSQSSKVWMCNTEQDSSNMIHTAKRLRH